MNIPDKNYFKKKKLVTGRELADELLERHCKHFIIKVILLKHFQTYADENGWSD
jgi:hypothetical protein